MSTFPDKITLPYQPHSKTSRLTAEKMVGKVGSARWRVYEYLKLFATQGTPLDEGGATDEEIQFALKMNPNTQRPRRIELLERGLIEASGMTRKTRSYHDATVWRVRQ